MNINQFSQMLGKAMTGDEIRSLQVHSLALGALINDAIFENEYDKLDFVVDEKVIAQKTKERIPNLYKENNELDETYLNSFLQQQQIKINSSNKDIDLIAVSSPFANSFCKKNK